MTKLVSYVARPRDKRDFGSGISILIVSLLSGCSIPLINQTASTSYQFKFAPTQPAKEILVCDDRTGSAKSSIYNAGLCLASRNLADIVRTGQGRITFTLTKFDHHSHLPELTLVTGQTAAVKPLPDHPLLSLFLDPTLKKQIMDQCTQLQDEAEQLPQQSQAQAALLEAEIAMNDSYHIPVEDIGTDVLGCLLKSNNLFSKDPGVQRYLLVISDLVQNIDISAGVSLLLFGVVGGIVFYCEDSARVCQDREPIYRSLLIRADAQVTFYDVSQINLLMPGPDSETPEDAA